MNLAMEIPTFHLKDLSPLTDMDFALAHLVLQDDQYAEFYKTQSRIGREVILDNSFHELGHPLGSIEIASAAEIINADYVVAPDVLGDPKATYNGFKEMLRTLNTTKHGLAVVLCGRDPIERLHYWEAVKNHAAMIMLPYRENRRSWIQEIPSKQLTGRYVHLLGVNTFEELSWFNAFFYRYDIFGSYDTCKPIKWAYVHEKRFTEDMDLRGSGRDSWTRPMTPNEYTCALYNIAFLRRFA